jgi:hypothetical protein
MMRRRIREVTVDDVKSMLDRGEDFDWSTRARRRVRARASAALPSSVEGDHRARRPDPPRRSCCTAAVGSARHWPPTTCRRGYTNVLSMDGGWREWTEKLYSVER